MGLGQSGPDAAPAAGTDEGLPGPALSSRGGPGVPPRQRVWTIDGETGRYPDVFVYSQQFNLLGVPAATTPVGVSADGMPVGVQIVGRPSEDWLVVSVATALESALRGD